MILFSSQLGVVTQVWVLLLSLPVLMIYLSAVLHYFILSL
jgi:capsular polysaccharide biosynthesis protein